jgi:hypothetical protein
MVGSFHPTRPARLGLATGDTEKGQAGTDWLAASWCLFVLGALSLAGNVIPSHPTDRPVATGSGICDVGVPSARITVSFRTPNTRGHREPSVTRLPLRAALSVM